LFEGLEIRKRPEEIRGVFVLAETRLAVVILKKAKNKFIHKRWLGGG
jgi:hypothetical protein